MQRRTNHEILPFFQRRLGPLITRKLCSVGQQEFWWFLSWKHLGGETMDPATCKLLTVILYAWLAVASLMMLMWAIYTHCSKCVVPPDVCQPLKVRFLHVTLLMLFGTDYILWKLGLNKRLALVNWAFDAIPPSDDPALSIQNKFFEGVHVRIYQPKRESEAQRRGIMFFHGGCGIFASIDTYERLCRYIARESDSVLVSVGYRLAPESPYPTQFNECHDATIHFMKNSENYGVDPAHIILCGDGFGGMVTAYLCQELKNRTDIPQVRAQVLLYPFLQAMDYSLPSYQQNSLFPLISRKDLLKFGAQYLDISLSMIEKAIGGNLVPESIQMKHRKWVHPDNIPYEFRIRNHNPAMPASPKDNLYNLINEVLDRKLSPLLADDSILQGLPETFILTCEYDVLRDDGLLYKKRLEDNGVLVSWCHLEDGFHAAPLLLNHWLVTFSCSKTGADSIVGYIRGL